MSTATVHQFPDPEIVTLAQRGLQLKNQIDDAQKELREVNARLVELAEYKPGSSTSHVRAGGVHAIVTQKEYVKWDQDGLEGVREKLGDETFFRLFSWEFSPRNKRDIDAYLEFGDEAVVASIKQAMTTKPGAPSVKYELDKKA